jgi:UDP-N-acetylmuramate dehydrogenase
MRKISFKELRNILPNVKRNVKLAPYTTFKIGGVAKYFYKANNRENLIKAILIAKRYNLPFFILGGGSNILISDKGFEGLVIKCQMSNVKCQNSKIKTESGTPLALVVTITEKNNLTGLEWTIGIPGTIGGAIAGNAGAFGKSMADVVEEVEVFNAKNEKVKILKKKDCKFSYRESIFKKNKNLIILSATLKLKKEKRLKIKKRMKEYLEHRKETQPLNLPSIGSIFKNPKSKIKNPKLLKQFPKLKEFNRKKEIPAAWLIEKCDLKGKKIGKAQISKKHANFIVNLNGAFAKDVKKLIELIKKKVKKIFKIQLKEEIEYLGF